VKIYLESTS